MNKILLAILFNIVSFNSWSNAADDDWLLLLRLNNVEFYVTTEREYGGNLVTKLKIVNHNSFKVKVTGFYNVKCNDDINYIPVDKNKGNIWGELKANSTQTSGYWWYPCVKKGVAAYDLSGFIVKNLEDGSSLEQSNDISKSESITFNNPRTKNNVQSTNESSLLTTANNYLNAGYVDKAEEKFNEVLRIDPHNKEALDGLEKIKEHKNKLKGIAQCKPTNSVLEVEGKAYIDPSSQNQTITPTTQRSEINEQFIRDENLVSSKEAKINELLNNARLNMSTNGHAQAMYAYEEVLKLDPTNTEAQNGKEKIALLYKNNEDKTKALTVFEEGKSLFGQQKFHDAIVKFEEAKMLDPAQTSAANQNIEICNRNLAALNTQAETDNKIKTVMAQNQRQEQSTTAHQTSSYSTPNYNKPTSYDNSQREGSMSNFLESQKKAQEQSARFEQSIMQEVNMFGQEFQIKNFAVDRINKLSRITFREDQSINSQIKQVLVQCEQIRAENAKAKVALDKQLANDLVKLEQMRQAAINKGDATSAYMTVIGGVAGALNTDAQKSKLEREVNEKIEAMEQKLANHLREEQTKLLNKHDDQLDRLKGTYYFEPDIDWENYLIACEEYHKKEMEHIRYDFSTKNGDWAEPLNNVPYEPRHIARRDFSSSQYFQIAKHKYEMYEQTNESEYLNASSEFTNKALLVDNANVDAVKFKVTNFSKNTLEGLILYDFALTKHPDDQEISALRQVQYHRFVPDFFKAIAINDKVFVQQACDYGYHRNLQNSNGENPIIYSIKNDKGAIFEILRKKTYETDSIYTSQLNTLLKICILENAHNTTNELIKDGVSPNSTFHFVRDSLDTLGFDLTALNYTSLTNKKETFLTLINNKADFEQSIANADTVQFQEIRYNLINLMMGRIVETDDTTHLNTILCRSPKLYDSTFQNSDTYLTYCVEASKNKVLEELLNRGGNANGHDKTGSPYMYAALNRNEIPTIAILKKHGGSYKGLKFENGYSVAHLAVKNHNFDLLKEVVNNDPAISNDIDDSKLKPLHLAIKNNDDQMTSFLLPTTTEIAVSIPDGNTPLFIALENTNSKIATMLLDKEPSLLNKQNKEGLTPIAHCVKNKTCLSMTDFLLSKGADPNTKTSTYWPILHLLVRDAEHSTVLELLKYKPDLNTKGAYGWTALHYAARENDFLMINSLIQAGANTSIKDKWGRTAFKITRERNFKEAKKLFKKKK